MVRITEETPKNTRTESQNAKGKVTFSTKDKTTLALIGVLIAESPEKVKRFLNAYGIQTSEKPKPDELSNKILYAIGKNSKQFNYELARLITRQVIPIDGQDSFDFSAFNGDEGGGPNVTVGVDPVSAIAGAVGSIASLFGNAQKKKMAKDQARSMTLQSLFAYKQQQEQAKASAQQGNRQMMLVKVIGGMALLALLGWLVFRYFIQQKQPATAAKTQTA
ncbi:MAG: hypothetical protein H6585_10110 [Flavobacteriales bacterium]|nr:hypothetical protein [Flavobacteriales bacterium]